MKFLITLLVLTLSIFLITTSCDKESDSSALPSVERIFVCQSEYDLYSSIFKGCNNSEEAIKITCNSSLEESFAITNYDSVYNEYSLCLVNLNNLSCDEINLIKTKNDLKNIEGCLVYQDVKKSETCDINTLTYCNNLFDTCGKDALYGICSTSYHEYVDGEGRNKKEFNYNNIKSYCDESINKDEKADFTDLFKRTCKNYATRCTSVPEFDFRNDDWKAECLSE